MNERERIEREAAAAARAWYWADSHDRTRVEPESMSGLVSAMTDLVLRERAAAFESAAKACKELRCEMNIVIPGSVPPRRMNHEDYDWNRALDKAAGQLEAFAGQERAHAGEGGGE